MSYSGSNSSNYYDKNIAIAQLQLDHNCAIATYMLHLLNNISADKSVQFSMANMLVNITNSYDKPDKTEEREAMEKLGMSMHMYISLVLTLN